MIDNVVFFLIWVGWGGGSVINSLSPLFFPFLGKTALIDVRGESRIADTPGLIGVNTWTGSFKLW